MPIIHSVHDLIDDAVQNGGTLTLRNETYHIAAPLMLGKLNLRGSSDLREAAALGTVEDETDDLRLGVDTRQ